MKRILLGLFALCFVALAPGLVPAQIIGDGIWGGRPRSTALAMSYTPVTFGTYNVAYTGATPSKSGGTAPYTFSMQAGTLPTGITLNTSTGVISGTDSTDSTGTTATGLVLRVTDSAGSPAHIDSSSFSLAIAATLTMSYTPVTTATYNVAYTGATPSTAGGTTSYVYTSTGAALPTGMTISPSTGVISGTDSTDSGGATYAGIVVTVTDAHSRVVNSSSFTITVSSGSYTGPGDQDTYVTWGGLRAYSAAKAAATAALIRVVDSSGANGTDIHCLANGNIDNTTLNAWIASHGTASVTKVYDQVGTFDLVQATVANMPTITQNAINTSYPAITFNGTSQVLFSASNITQAQPFTFTAVALSTITAGTGNLQHIIGDQSAPASEVALEFWNQYWAFDMNQASAAASGYVANTFFSLQGFGNNSGSATSIITVNGADTSLTVSTNGLSSQLTWGRGNGANYYLAGKIVEAGVKNGAVGSRSGVSSNARTYWGI
jgi:hypothetical protein